MANIRKELSKLSDKLKFENVPNYHNEAKRLINLKYGKNWRDLEQIKSLNISNEKLHISHY